MAKLSVPYIKQFADGACGAAALEMIYRFYNVNDVDQAAIFAAFQEKEPHGSGELRITTDNMVADAKSRGFVADWFRVNFSDQATAITIIKENCAKSIALVACQRYTQQQPLLGHFRVITGCDKKRIFAHDPCPKFGGADFAYRIDEFLDAWKPTGANITGGVTIRITR
jgi:predicted double-glycine peptidase